MLQRVTPDMLGRLAAGLMLVAAFAGPWVGEPVAFRTLSYGLTVLIIGVAVRARRAQPQPLSRVTWLMLLTASLIWFESVAISRYLGFAINGVDFSVFDWMLESTTRGRLAYSPIYDVNHLGVHSSLLLLVLTPLHALVHTPWWLLLTGPALLWACVFPLRRLVRWAGGEHDGVLLLLVLLAWLANAWVGRLVNDGFRIESAIPLFSLWFLVCWLEERTWSTALAAAALLLTKEDTALYLASFCVVAVMVERRRWKLALPIFVTSLCFLAAYVAIVQPLLVPARAGWAGFWSDFGPTPVLAVQGMAQHPLALLARLATSAAPGFFATLLFLPWLSPRAAAGLAPTTFLLGAATYDTMHRFGTYYPVPLVAFAFFGLLEVWRTRRVPQPLVLAALALFPLVHDGYAKSAPINLERLAGMNDVRRLTDTAQRVCAQPVLFPHLAYPNHLEPLFDLACAETPGTTTVVNLSLTPWPLTKAQLETALTRWNETQLTRLPGGFVVIGPR